MIRRLKYAWRGCRGLRRRWIDKRPLVQIGVDVLPRTTDTHAVDAPTTRSAVTRVTPACDPIDIINPHEVLCDRRV